MPHLDSVRIIIQTKSIREDIKVDEKCKLQHTYMKTECDRPCERCDMSAQVRYVC